MDCCRGGGKTHLVLLNMTDIPQGEGESRGEREREGRQRTGLSHQRPHLLRSDDVFPSKQNPTTSNLIQPKGWGRRKTGLTLWHSWEIYVFPHCCPLLLQLEWLQWIKMLVPGLTIVLFQCLKCTGRKKISPITIFFLFERLWLNIKLLLRPINSSTKPRASGRWTVWKHA